MSHFRKPKLMPNKLVSMKEAIADSVKPGCNLYIEGFTHLISFAAGHEIVGVALERERHAIIRPHLLNAFAPWSLSARFAAFAAERLARNSAICCGVFAPAM